MDLGRQVGTENPIRSDQIQVRSGQIRPIVSGQAGSGEVRSDQSNVRNFFLELGGVRVLPAMKGWVLPRGQEPLGPDTLGFFTAPFWPFWQPSFFHRFFDAIFDRSSLDFASQLGSPNPPKSMKHRCQDAFPC